MKQLALAIALMVFPVAAFPVAARAEAPAHVINDGGATLTLDCGDGGRIVINGADNTITAIGGCEKVVVNGSGNKVAIIAADKIVVTGSNNAVTYQRGFTKKSPKVARLGVGNTIAKIK